MDIVISQAALARAIAAALTTYANEISQGSTTPAPSPTPSPTPGTSPSPTPTPSQPSDGLMVASAPNALAYDRSQTTSADTHRLVTFPVIFGPDGALEIAYGFHNTAVGMDPNAPGNPVFMSGCMLTSLTGTTKTLTDRVRSEHKALGVSSSFKPEDFGLLKFPKNQVWKGQALLSVEKAGDFLPGSLNIRDKDNFTCFTMDADGGQRRQVYDACPIPQVLGVLPAGTRSVLIAGHSWFRGNDYVSATSRFAKGMLADVGEKAMVDPATGYVTPFINGAKYGHALNGAFDTTNDPWMTWVPKVTDVIDGLGYNDTSQGIENIKANHKRLWAAERALNPSVRIYAMAIFGDGMSQRTGGLPEAYLAFLYESKAAGLITDVIPLNSIKDPSDPTRARAGMLNASDHPTPGVGVEAIAAEIRAVMFGN